MRLSTSPKRKKNSMSQQENVFYWNFKNSHKIFPNNILFLVQVSYYKYFPNGILHHHSMIVETSHRIYKKIFNI